ncbi:hypothetical protein [Streptomyces chiangmaiensis]|uniref:Uncharacterized protein n=1 Tax=Streptomyces chiangmaiensis TaxID=766497 RepID=A0ABU7FV67_9ACTN|nr:hypothetical protein [Streptomyces chiangmaiensis]MED7828002.1 hypothetical protein [Streptomyces chiangmaiensis]
MDDGPLIAVPDHWSGRPFTGDVEIADALKANADQGRALGQLPMA